MKRNWNIRLAIVAVILLGVVFSSRTAPGGDEWQPISQEELALKDNPASLGADAMSLSREDVINAKAAWDDEYLRYKIFTKEGVSDLADVSIPFDPSQG